MDMVGGWFKGREREGDGGRMSCCSCWIFPRLLRTKFLFPLAFIVFTQCNKGWERGQWQMCAREGRGCNTVEGGLVERQQAKPQPNKHISIKTLDGSTGNSSKCSNSSSDSNNKRDNNKRNSDSHVGGHVLRHGHNKVQAWQAGGVGEGKVAWYGDQHGSC